MLLEIITLSVQAPRAQAFEQAFYAVQASLCAMPGYSAHELQRSLDEPGHYLLLIEWQELSELPPHLAPRWWQGLQAFWAEVPAPHRYRQVAGLGIHTPPRPVSDFAD